MILLAAVTHHAANITHHAAATSDTPPYAGYAVWATVVVITYFVARSKQRNPTGWVLLSIPFVFVPLLILLFMPKGDYLPQRVLTAEELRRQNNAEAERGRGEQLLQIQSGHITPFIPNGVMPLAGEQFFWEQRAQYGQTQTQTVHKGASPALYVPLGHGVRARVGGYNGSTQRVTNFVWGAYGTVYVSNMRVLFKADDGNIAQAPYHQVVTYDAFPDGLGLNVPPIGIMQFRTGDECLGAVFLKMVNGPPKDELTNTTALPPDV